MNFFIGVVVGIIIGWWFLKQPQFMVDLYKKIFGETLPKEPDV